MDVVIVNWNTKLLLDQCLKSLSDCRVIVVDNGSTDDSASVGRRHNVKWVQNSTNVGMAKALNQGLVLCESEFVLILHPDTVVKEGCIEAMTAYLSSHPEVGVVGPRMMYPDGSVFFNTHHFPKIKYLIGEASSLLRAFGLESVYMRSADYSLERSVDIVASAGMIVRRSLFSKVGMFDEDFHSWMAEWEFCFRVKKAGHQIMFVPSGEIVHYESQTPSQLRQGEMEYKKYSHHIANRMIEALFLFYKKCWPSQLGRLKWFTLMRFRVAIALATLKGDKGRKKNYKKAVEFVKRYEY